MFTTDPAMFDHFFEDEFSIQNNSFHNYSLYATYGKIYIKAKESTIKGYELQLLIENLKLKDESGFRRWFEKNLGKLGFEKIILSQRICPDYVIQAKDKTILRVELEFDSDNFILHGHDKSKVDLIIAYHSDKDKIEGTPVWFINKKEKKVSISEVPELPEYGLRTIFGDSALVRILDFLILYRGSVYSMSEIARNSHVSWRAFNRVWPKIISLGVVKDEGRQGRAKLYRFNEESPLAKMFVKMTLEFALSQAERKEASVPVGLGRITERAALAHEA